ncbi:hypothetical protein [Streptomyces sp. NPDC055681]
MLGLIVGNAIESVRSGEATVEEAILHAAVHGWYEGHVQGEDECPGCGFRGGLPKDSARLTTPERRGAPPTYRWRSSAFRLLLAYSR